MSHSFDEYYAVYDETFPRARKLHHCGACWEEIHPGHQYARVCTVSDGSATTYKRCMRCQRLHEHLRGLAPGEMWPAERLDCGEEYTEHWDRPPPDDIAALAFALPGETK